MLTNDIACNLIKRFEQCTQYKISIVDDNGIILASRNKERVGTFHKNAYHLITNGLSDFAYPYGFDGDEGGIILPLSLGNATVGAIEILGVPENVRDPAQLMKAAIEEMMEAQVRHDRRSQQSTLIGRFCEQLLYTTISDLPHLEARARMLGYYSDCPRISIMIVPFREQYQDLVEYLCRDSEDITSQEIIMRPVGVQTLVFLRLKTAPPLCRSYRNQVESYLSPIMEQLEKKGVQCKYFVGSIQNQLDRYHTSFQHCMWMSKHVSHNYPFHSVIYFYDHVYEYLRSKINLEEFSGIFEAFTQYEPESFWEDFIPIVATMNRYQNNMIKSSEVLHMHKNTLAYRYKQIRTQLALDPLQSAADDIFTTELCYYLQKR